MVDAYDRRRSRSRSRERHRSRSPGIKSRQSHHRSTRSPSPRNNSARRNSHDRSRHIPEREKRHEGSPHQHKSGHEHGGHQGGRQRDHLEADRRGDGYDGGRDGSGRDGPRGGRSGSGREGQQRLPPPPRHQQLPPPPGQQRLPVPPGPPQSGPRPGPPRSGSPQQGGKPRWGKDDEQDDKKDREPTPPPDFGYSGKLVEEANKVNGVVCKYTEPPESQKPEKRWRLYIFKNNQLMDDPLYIHRQAWFMFGRERRLVDIPTDHPSCSKQHAVLQFRLVESTDDYGVNQQVVKPYLMDLGSVNGSFINGDRLEANRYYELLEKDCIKFGLSSREYILLHETSA